MKSDNLISEHFAIPLVPEKPESRMERIKHLVHKLTKPWHKPLLPTRTTTSVLVAAVLIISLSPKIELLHEYQRSVGTIEAAIPANALAMPPAKIAHAAKAVVPARKPAVPHWALAMNGRG